MPASVATRIQSQYEGQARTTSARFTRLVFDEDANNVYVTVTRRDLSSVVLDRAP